MTFALKGRFQNVEIVHIDFADEFSETTETQSHSIQKVKCGTGASQLALVRIDEPDGIDSAADRIPVYSFENESLDKSRSSAVVRVAVDQLRLRLRRSAKYHANAKGGLQLIVLLSNRRTHAVPGDVIRYNQQRDRQELDCTVELMSKAGKHVAIEGFPLEGAGTSGFDRRERNQEDDDFIAEKYSQGSIALLEMEMKARSRATSGTGSGSQSQSQSGVGSGSGAGIGIRTGKALGVPTYDMELNMGKGTASGMLPGVKTAMTTAFEGQLFSGQMASQLQKTVGSSLTHLVATEITRAIAGPISYNFPGNTADPIVDKLVPDVAKKCKEFFDSNIATKSGVPEEVAARLNKTFSQALSRFTPETLSHNISSMVLPHTGHVLSTALAQTLLPAFIETFTRSPLADYYCYYCSKYKTYCDYCPGRSEQLYWGQYYAGYYSTYYASYYADASGQFESSVANQTVGQASIYSDRNRDTLVLGVSAANYGWGRPNGSNPQVDDAQYQEPDVPKYPGVEASS
eukprot:CAMPEP_0197540200 /NCGR_PEP_ID=MMETSP1318-20131121/65067_1 /TAXON_ID=552666 /ORGANISM="Partenskyella glossopodia, Strain RCC365" /LENGTH=515 /DNA_ID=CAMNT_0043099123 /DNA_START=163 /DNA_END=1710 /DNA_ORIENTATION=-